MREVVTRIARAGAATMLDFEVMSRSEVDKDVTRGGVQPVTS
jgi:hypothetical protein